MSATDASLREAAERANFEQWAKDYGRIFLDRQGDGYAFSYTNEAWVAWKARAALAQQAPAVAVATTAEASGPRIQSRTTCKGCPSLKTEHWTDYLENDETDSGTAATCLMNGKSISAYWHEGDATPDWCPAAAQQAPAAEPVAQPSAEYKRGWDDCMELWADHMKRMNDALTKPLPEGWANHAHHIAQNVREALATAPQPPQAQPLTWQPIETAPTDETPFLAFKPKLGAFAALILGTDHPDCEYDGGVHCGWDHKYVEGVTHWMPLPASPSGIKGAA